MLRGAVVHLHPRLRPLHSLLEGGAGAPSSIDILAGACLIHGDRRPVRTTQDLGRKPAHEAAKGVVLVEVDMVNVRLAVIPCSSETRVGRRREAVW